MPDEIYQIVSVPTIWDVPESRGTRKKFWLRIGGGTDRWLLKIPRTDTGEHWAEKVTAEIGRLIGVDCAHVELARCVEKAVFRHNLDELQEEQQAQQTDSTLLATICKSFLPDELDKEYDFFHGWEVLQYVVEGYDTNRRFGQRDHNVKNIVAALADFMGINSQNPMPRWDDTLEDLVSYALLDGLVGNTDRHHENWMIANVHSYGDMITEIMPSFDHASSLGRELTDEKRRWILESDGVLRYVQRGHGGVYLDSRRKRAPSPLRLARLLCRWKPTFTRRTLDRIESVAEPEIRASIRKVPPEFMSDIAKEFACQVVMTSKKELLRSVR